MINGYFRGSRADRVALCYTRHLNFMSSPPELALPSRVLLFDFDGVIADSLAAYYPVFADTCRELGFQGPATLEAFLDVFDTNAITGLRRAGVPLLKLRQLGRALAPRVAALNAEVAPFPGMVALLCECAAREPVYVVTSNMTEPTAAFLAEHAITGLRGVIGGDQESSKVKKIRRIARQHRGLAPWYIGDTRGDMIEGRAAGATTVGTGWGWHGRERLALAGPDFLVDTVPDLEALLRGPSAEPDRLR